MAKKKESKNDIDESLKKKKDIFIDKINSNMHYVSDFDSKSFSFEWLDQIEYACPFIDTIVRIPKLALIKEELLVKAEKSKKITVESVKDLAKHPNYIEEKDEKTNEYKPKQILNVINEETYNIYENRFLYTLINQMEEFVLTKEDELKNFTLHEDKSLEYSASTVTDYENVNIEMRVTSKTFPSNNLDKKLKDEIRKAKARIKKVKSYISSWHVSPMFKELGHLHVKFIKPPIRKTNIILKNTNFQVASKLFDYLQNIASKEDTSNIDNLEKEKDPIQAFLDHSFLIDFCVLDSVAKTKREQKEKMSQYALLLLKEEIHRTMSLLLSCGIEVTDDEIIRMVTDELKREKTKRVVGEDDVKKKFKSAVDEYLERMQDYL